MGGGKRRIPMARIADLQARRVCFAKRRKGLFSKCLELCDLFPGYQVAAVAFSPDVGNSFAFAAPSTSASPADLFRRFLSGFDCTAAGVNTVAAGGSGPGGPRTVEEDGAHHYCVSGLSSSASLDDELESAQTILDEEEWAELAAALRWADSVLAFGDGPRGGGGGSPHHPAAVATAINPFLSEEEEEEEDDVAAVSVLVPDDAAAALGVTASPPPPPPQTRSLEGFWPY